MTLSLRAYARHRGISHTAVQKAIQTGRIELEPDGSIDPDKADAQWSVNTRAYSPQGTQQAKRPVTMAETSPTGQDAYLQARATNEILRVQRQKLKLQAERGELIHRQAVVDQVLRCGRIERDAWLQWPARIASELAATLNVDAHTLHMELEKYVNKHLRQLATIEYVEEPVVKPEDDPESDDDSDGDGDNDDDDLAL